MKVLTKDSDGISVLAFPDEKVNLGDYLLVHQVGQRESLVLQVYEEGYLELNSVTEEIIREELLSITGEGILHDPHDVSHVSRIIRDLRVLGCKTRGSIAQNGSFSMGSIWLPSRAESTISSLSTHNLLKASGRKLGHKIDIGTTGDEHEFSINAEDLDGCLSIITGKKGSGKSHLAKLLASQLVEHGAYVFVFDVNDEYHALAPETIEGKSKVIRWKPGDSLRFTLPYIGKSSISNLLTSVLETPDVSLREFLRIWDNLESQDMLSLSRFGDAIRTWKCNGFVREALSSRYYALVGSRLFTDNDDNAVTIEESIAAHPRGGLFCISLKRSGYSTRRLTIEIILSKILELLERSAIPPVFLFAEEAQLYLRETSWDDLVTRMRHYGIFTTFITNQPDALRNNVYRQADNIFLFNFTNETDLDSISNASTVDRDTLRAIVKTLPTRSCVVLGRTVNELPIVARVSPLGLTALGETRLFFSDRTKIPQLLLAVPKTNGNQTRLSIE